MKHRHRDYYRGEIYYADLRPVFGHEQGGIRPVLILQNDLGNCFSPTVIVTVASCRIRKKPRQPTHVVLDHVEGLAHRSQFQLETLRTVDKRRLRERVGKLTEQQMEEIDAALRVSLYLDEDDYLPNMSRMFRNCFSLEKLDIRNFDTSNVTDMKEMFRKCQCLKAIDVRNFDTSSVTDMREMFSICNELEDIDLSRFNTSNVTSMQMMFNGCISLKTLDLSNFDTSNVTDMYGMFCNCFSLEKLDIRNFDTSNVTDMEEMLGHCTMLKTLYSGNLDIHEVEKRRISIENAIQYMIKSKITLSV